VGRSTDRVGAEEGSAGFLLDLSPPVGEGVRGGTVGTVNSVGVGLETLVEFFLLLTPTIK
jgi:hypothetical protein